MEQPSYRYIVSPPDGFGSDGKWCVWHADSLIRMSDHDSEREANAAVKRYEAADLRRRRANQP